MIVCPTCSNESPDNSVFCGFCGHKLQADAPKKTLFAFAAVKRDEVEGKTDVAALDDAPREPSPESATYHDLAGAHAAALADRRAPDESALDQGWDVELDHGDTSVGMSAINKPASDEPAAGKPALGKLSFSAADVVQKSRQKAARDREVATSAADTVREERSELDNAAPPEPEPEPADAAPLTGESRLKSGVNFQYNQPEPSVVARDSVPTEASARDTKGGGLSLDGGDDAHDTEPMVDTGGGNYPAPSIPGGGAKPADKEDEQSFFGASLSQYGMAPVGKASGPAADEPPIDSELEQVKSGSFTMMIITLVVLGLIVGAIAFLMAQGSR